MSVALTELAAYLGDYLQVARFRDYCPNGLQVQGVAEVGRLATGVTACQALLDAAVDWDADAVLVHHGYFWRGESPEVVGMKRRRLATLLGNDISLLAYHLPLDAHPHVGNNAQLGRLLGLDMAAALPLQPAQDDGVGNIASLPQPQPVAEFLARLQQVSGRPALHVGDAKATVRRIAWCTGAAQGYIEAAVAAGADLFLTGEASEQTVHVAREENIHFVAAGHHATERFGVQALGRHLAERFGLEHRFFDIDNPV